MIQKINRNQMGMDALNSGNYEKFIEDVILTKLDEIVETLNKLQGSIND